MTKVIKANVLTGRYAGETVRITNISLDEMGRQKAACTLKNGTRANISMSELALIEETPEPEIIKPKSASMPFISGSASSRTLTHTKNMAKNKVKPTVIRLCEKCGLEYNPDNHIQCENCADESEI